jgi:hypothetical protein
MLEKLAGRLKWEHSGQGIRIEIPAQWGWQILFINAPLEILLIAGIALAVSEIGWPLPVGDDRLIFGILSAVVLGAIACLAAAWLAWSFTGRTIVTADQNEMKIQRKVLGVEWDTRRFATFEVRGLRWLPPTEIWAFRTDTDPNTSKIKFQVRNKTIKFARGISEREACALIGRMEEICNFSNDS